MTIPMDWVDKIYLCMHQFYGDKWVDNFGKSKESFYKTIWQSALTGLTYDQIRKALVYYKWESSQCGFSIPPTPMEFFRLAKQSNHTFITPSPKVEEGKAANPEVAKAALAEIRQRLGKSHELRSTWNKLDIAA